MKRNMIKASLTIFEGMNTELRVRPYVELVMQCYNCYKYGHTKSKCRSNTRCVICADLAHGNCQEVTRCRNCGGNHRSSSRVCPIYEQNKTIKQIIAWNNVSYFEAMKILQGEENNRQQEYTRYSRLEKWPALPVPRKKFLSINDDIDNQKLREKVKNINTSPKRRLLIEQDTREYAIRKSRNIKEETKQKLREHWKQFNTRGYEISRENYGLAARDNY